MVSSSAPLGWLAVVFFCLFLSFLRSAVLLPFQLIFPLVFLIIMVFFCPSFFSFSLQICIVIYFLSYQLNPYTTAVITQQRSYDSSCEKSGIPRLRCPTHDHDQTHKTCARQNAGSCQLRERAFTCNPKTAALLASHTITFALTASG